MTRGQDSTSDSNQGTFYLDYRSNGINLLRDQNNVVATDTFVHNNRPVTGWMSQSSSSVNNQNPFRFQDLLAEDGLVFNGVDQSTSNMNIQTLVRFQDLLTEDGLHSSSVDVGTSQSLEERHSRPIIAPFTYSVDTSLGNSQLTNRQLSLQQARCSALPRSINLNAACNGHNIDASLNMATGLCLNPLKLSGSDANENAFTSDPSNSNSLVISSGVAGYVLEENEGGEGHSSVGRRLSCKRRSPEDHSRQLSSFGESSRQAQKFVNTRENAIRRLNLSATRRLNLTSTNNQSNITNSEQLSTGHVAGLGAAPVMHQPSSTAASGLGVGAEAEPFQRNIWLRRTVNQHGLLPANLVESNNSYAQLPVQPAVIFPCNCVPKPTGRVHPTPPIQQHVHVPPEFQRRNLEHFLTDPNFVPGTTNPNFVLGTNFPRNIVSSSRNSSNSHFHQSSPSIWFSQGNMAQQYAQGILNTVNHTEYQRQGSYWPQHLGLSVATRERELSAISGNARPYQIPLRSGLTARVERQTGAHSEVALHSLIAAQRRRLVSEVRNALALVRRGSSLQLEDVMVIDRSVLYGAPEEPDMHEDMRLDVDNMSYEELLALEERIGNVCTGLSEDAILAHMKPQKYEAIAKGPPLKDEPCCICQEDYAESEDLGKLDCGHDFHFNCIKRWLVHKNNCPICKMTGLEF